MSAAKSVRYHLSGFGDQPDPAAAAADHLDARRKIFPVTEVPGQSQPVWTSKSQSAVFLSSMRHFRNRQWQLRKKSNRPMKPCAVGGKIFAWRKQWTRGWAKVMACSNAGRTRKNGGIRG